MSGTAVVDRTPYSSCGGGLMPERTPHILETTKVVGNDAPERIERIDQVALEVISPDVPFRTVQEFEHLRVKADSSWRQETNGKLLSFPGGYR